MASKKYKERYVTTIPFEREIYFEVERSLPRGVTISDELNAFLKDRYNELQSKKKNLNAQPIGIQYSTRLVISDNIETTDIKIDIYNLTIEEIRQQLEIVHNISKLTELERKGRTIQNISRNLKQERLLDKKANEKLESLLQTQNNKK